jgi:DNA gyrase inhibitor GyrI
MVSERVLVGSERLAAAIEDMFQELLKKAMKEMEQYPDFPVILNEKSAHAAAGRSLDRCLHLLARRAKEGV